MRRAQGYITTEVKCESVSEGRYRVLDFWIGYRAFEIFRERYSEDFSEFERQIVGGLVKKEQFVGAYYEADSDDLLPA